MLIPHFTSGTVSLGWSIQLWLEEYNRIRPHGALNYLTPAAFADRYRKERKEAA